MLGKILIVSNDLSRNTLRSRLGCFGPADDKA